MEYDDLPESMSPSSRRAVVLNLSPQSEEGAKLNIKSPLHPEIVEPESLTTDLREKERLQAKSTEPVESTSVDVEADTDVRRDEESSLTDEEKLQKRKEFFDSLNLSSDIADEEDNWVINENSGYPELDVLPNVGDYAQTSFKNKTKKNIESVNARLRKRYERICKALPDADAHKRVMRSYLDKILTFDIGVGMALDEMSMELQEADLPPITTTAFNTLVHNKEKIEAIFMLQGLIRASGLTLYEEDLLSAFIPTLFRNKTNSVTRSDLVNFVKNYNPK